MPTLTLDAPAAEVVAATDTLTRAAWLALRRTGLGGSDAATVLGLNPYASPLDLYLDKVGLAEDRPETEAMWWGRALEPLVAERFALTLPYTVHALPQMLRHRTHPFLLANVDRVLLDPAHPERGPGILEIKAPGARQLPHWGPDQAPDPYFIQLQHYLAVTGWTWGYLAARVGNQQTYCIPVARDDAFIAGLIAAESAFWQRVVHRQPPPVDGSPSGAALLKQLYPRATDDTRSLPPTAVADITAWLAASAAERAAHRDREAAEQRLKAQLGDAARGTVAGYQVRWANRVRTGLDTKRLATEHPDLVAAYQVETPYRVFSIQAPKEAS